MGFLDNLESSLKSLESQEERDSSRFQKRQDERAQTLAAAPWADELKNSGYTKDLLTKAAVAGHRIRAKIYMAWIDTTLRLEVRGRKLELVPTPDGIVAEYIDPAGETIRGPVDLAANPDELLQRWLG